jgi:glycosyltransferase involved in cell wall biosynthesis
MTPRRTRVLFVMMQMAMGGSERLVLNLARHLDRSRFEPSIAWLHGERALPEFEELGIPLHFVPKRSRVDVGAMRRLAAIVRANGIDVVNAHHFMPFFYAWGGSRIAGRARLFYTEHSEADVLHVRGRWPRIAHYLVRWSDGAIGVSERVSRMLCRHFRLDPSSVETITNGVDLEAFRPDATVRADVRRTLGLAADDVVIGHVANFRRNKNHRFLLEAFAEAVRNRPRLKLLLLGQGFEGDPENSRPEAVRFIERAGLQSSVQLLGYRPDVENVLRALDVFCLVSYKEGLPLSVIEAMATSLPVVATDIDGLRDVVHPDVNGLLVTPDDVAGLAGTLARLADDPALRRQMGEAGGQVAREKYSLARCVRETEALFLSAVSGRAAAAAARESQVA